MSPARRALTGALLAGGVLWLLLAGVAAAVPAPPAWSLEGVEGWYDGVGPAAALAAIVRGGAAVVAGWVLMACLLQAVTALRPLGWLRPLADAVAPRSLQQLVRGAAGLSMAAGVALPPPGGALPGAPMPQPTAEVVVMQAIGDDDPAGAVTMTPLDDAAAPVLLPVDVAPDEPAAGTPATTVVAPGDSLWSVAEADLAEAVASTPSDAAVAEHWVRLIDLNRDRLVDPGNPDLIFPGQELLLPPR